MKIIGILSASGAGARKNGILKFYLHIEESNTPIEWHIEQRQSELDRNYSVLNVEDENPNCNYELIGAASSFRGVRLAPQVSSPSIQFNSWIHESLEIESSILLGEYINAEPLEGLVHLYPVLGKDVVK